MRPTYGIHAFVLIVHHAIVLHGRRFLIAKYAILLPFCALLCL